MVDSVLPARFADLFRFLCKPLDCHDHGDVEHVLEYADHLVGRPVP